MEFGSGSTGSAGSSGSTGWNSAADPADPPDPPDPPETVHDRQVGPRVTRAGGQDDGSYTNSLKLTSYVPPESSKKLSISEIHVDVQTHANKVSNGGYDGSKTPKIIQRDPKSTSCAT